LIFPNPAKTEKLNPTKMFTIVNIAPKLSISQDKINFSPKSIKAISGHNITNNIAKKNENSKK
jgi:hypothetical protein